ncbi:hypothetical protein GCM10023195_39730 [Actinoallomurus liliacearum]|uniref:Uncharacterized protein n=1 Tax=Actinoallomurus liliacearum TaxID=1080073 RepID=A0ABP8TMU9_9ACTN
MQRSRLVDSGGWQRYTYERTAVRQAAQTQRSPFWTKFDRSTLSQRCGSGPLQFGMTGIVLQPRGHCPGPRRAGRYPAPPRRSRPCAKEPGLIGIVVGSVVGRLGRS